MNRIKSWSLAKALMLLTMSGSAFATCEAEKEAAYKYAANPTQLQTFKKDFESWADSMRTNSPDWRKTQLEFTKNQVSISRSSPGQLAYATAVHCVALAAAATQPQQTPQQNQSTQQQAQQGQQQNQSAQQQSQQAQQQAQQTQEAARVAQTRADQARQGQRKTHDPAAEAHECISIDNAGSGNFGAFKNTCNYKVNFSTCNFRPRTIQGGFNWSADFDCEKRQYGLHTPNAGASVAAHNRNTEMVYWFACKAPAFPVDTEFVAGSGVRGRCH